nr:TadE/TadG family type IV pilus assembly protein [Micromonospora sp. DSM 115978]
MGTRRSTCDGDRGSASVEVAILAPAFIFLIVLAGVLGRSAVGDQAVEFAAHDAARAASIARTAVEARDAAEAAAEKQLDWTGLACTDEPELAFDGHVGGLPVGFDEAFASAPGQDASVTVTVSCFVTFLDLSTEDLVLAEGRLVEAAFTSPLDRYRARSD